MDSKNEERDEGQGDAPGNRTSDPETVTSIQTMISDQEEQRMWEEYLDHFVSDLTTMRLSQSNGTETPLRESPIMGVYVSELVEKYGILGIVWWWMNSVRLAIHLLEHNDGAGISSPAPKDIYEGLTRLHEDAGLNRGDRLAECSMFLLHLRRFMETFLLPVSTLDDTSPEATDVWRQFFARMLDEIQGEGNIGILDDTCRGAYSFLLAIGDFIADDNDGKIDLPAQCPVITRAIVVTDE